MVALVSIRFDKVEVSMAESFKLIRVDKEDVSDANSFKLIRLDKDDVSAFLKYGLSIVDVSAMLTFKLILEFKLDELSVTPLLAATIRFDNEKVSLAKRLLNMAEVSVFLK